MKQIKPFLLVSTFLLTYLLAESNSKANNTPLPFPSSNPIGLPSFAPLPSPTTPPVLPPTPIPVPSQPTPGDQENIRHLSCYEANRAPIALFITENTQRNLDGWSYEATITLEYLISGGGRFQQAYSATAQRDYQYHNGEHRLVSHYHIEERTDVLVVIFENNYFFNELRGYAFFEPFSRRFDLICNIQNSYLPSTLK